MEISKNEAVKLERLWKEYGAFFESLIGKMIQDYEKMLHRPNSEWDAAQQLAEFCAKKQALLELKKVLTAIKED